MRPYYVSPDPRSEQARLLCGAIKEELFREIEFLPVQLGQYVRMSTRVFVKMPGHGGVVDPLSHALTAGLKTWILTRKLEERSYTLEIKVPRTLFDHVKLWLGWGRVRWRSVKQKVTFTVTSAYPEANVVPEKVGKPIVFAELIEPSPVWAYPAEKEASDAVQGQEGPEGQGA